MEVDLLGRLHPHLDAIVRASIVEQALAVLGLLHHVCPSGLLGVQAKATAAGRGCELVVGLLPHHLALCHVIDD
eukprot:14865556-Alexandrium_andersonii.AAC.1